jgi:hypothetical protein
MPLPSEGEGFLTITKNTLISGFLALPIILITITGFLGTATCNLGMLILFLAQVFVVPGVQFILNFIRNRNLFDYLFGGKLPFYASSTRLCALSPVDADDDIQMPFISYWLAQVVFFTSFVISNGVALYTLEPAKGADPMKTENRKAQALTAIILTAVLLGLAIVAHVRVVGCDDWRVAIFGIVLYASLGVGIFKLAEVCGLRNADTFGVASRLATFITPDPGFPYACVNITTS